MKDDMTTVMHKVVPDLFEPPHILPDLMELFAGESPHVLAEQEQWLRHFANCHYCRTAVVFLLNVAQEYDHRNNNPAEPARDLLRRFAAINREIEAHDAQEASEFERIGAYAEAIVAEGREKAAQRFPDLVAHLQICPDCSSILEATIASITEEEKN